MARSSFGRSSYGHSSLGYSPISSHFGGYLVGRSLSNFGRSLSSHFTPYLSFQLGHTLLTNRSFSTNGSNISSNTIIINSEYDNLVFENDKAVLMLPPFRDFLYHIDEFRKDWRRCRFNKDIIICSDFNNCLIKVLANLESGYYRFDMYFYYLDKYNSNIGD